MAANDIVYVSVTQQQAPIPNNLQEKGVIVTQGGTTTAAGTLSFVADSASLSAILSSPTNQLRNAYNTFAANNQFGRGVYVLELGAGASAAYIIGGNMAADIYSQSSAWVGILDGGFTISVDGVAHNLSALNFSTALTMLDVAAIIQAAITTAVATVTWTGAGFRFASATTGATSSITAATAPATGTDISVFMRMTSSLASLPVAGHAAGNAAGVSALDLFIQSHLNQFYAYMLPDNWDAESATLKPLISRYSDANSMVYFMFHATATTLPVYAGLKAAIGLIKSSLGAATECPIACFFGLLINRSPNVLSRSAQFKFNQVNGVTAYPLTLQDASVFKAANLNYIDTGAEGGLSNTILKWGATGDGRDMQYWYNVDWVRINLRLFIANEVLNGSIANAANPLLYDQTGIDRLRNKSKSVMDIGTSYGIVNASAATTVSAIDFLTYGKQNPTHYRLGIYNGISVTFTPAAGFAQITIGVLATDFIV